MGLQALLQNLLFSGGQPGGGVPPMPGAPRISLPVSGPSGYNAQAPALPGFSSPIPFNPNPGMLPDPGIDTSAADAATRALLQLLQSRPATRRRPRPTRPAFRAPDLATGLGGTLLALALGGDKGAAAYGGSYIQAKNQAADRKTQGELEQWRADTQEDEQAWADRVRSAQYGAGVEEGKLNRAYSERDKETAQSGRADLERMKQQFKLQQDTQKASDREKLEQTKALLRRLPPEARGLLAKERGYDQSFQDAVMELTVEEYEKRAKGAREQELQPGKLKEQDLKLQELDKKLIKYDDEHKKTIAQIDKWEKDYKLRQGTAGLQREKFEWEKTKPGGVSKVDQKIFTLQLEKEKLINEAKEWHNQMPSVFGNEMPTHNGKEGLDKIRRSIAGIDGQLKRLRGIGGSVSLDKELATAEKYITAGADRAAVAKRFKERTGVEYPG